MITPRKPGILRGSLLRRPCSATPVISREAIVQKKSLHFTDLDIACAENEPNRCCLTVNGESCNLQERPSSRARRKLTQEGTEAEKCEKEVVQEYTQQVLEKSDEPYRRLSPPETWATNLPKRPAPCRNSSAPLSLHLYLPNLSPEEDEEKIPNKCDDLIEDTRDTVNESNSGRGQQEGSGATSLFQPFSGPGENLPMTMNGCKVKLAPKQPESKKPLTRPYSAKENMTSRHILPTNTFMLQFLDREDTTTAYSARRSITLSKEERDLALEELLKGSNDIIRFYRSEHRRHVRNEAFWPTDF